MGKIPPIWKQGLIVPLYKGDDKQKTSTNSYRPVALLSCFLKIFENVLNSRISKYVLDSQCFPNKQQQGFQEKLGCLTASFNLQEIVYYNLEQGSNVFVGFLDSSKAFDIVWRHGLLFKLYNLGVTGKLWTIINDCHSNTSSSISRWFNVLQGVRQGGVLSTFLYLVFINDLINSIEQLYTCTKLLNIICNCPSLADDISLIALTPNSLQNMLDVANTYSRRWRFKFNANKSSILQFRSKGNQLKEGSIWTLGDTPVPCSDSCTHLGIIINSKCSLSERIKSVCRKGRNSFYALTDIGSPYLNPLTLASLYKSVVLPSVLYGCELWNNPTAADCQRLQVFQHSLCKSAQNLPSRTRSDICESLLNILPISTEIDTRKLLFFGRPCRMSYQTLPKQIFLVRLFSYFEGLGKSQCGFIPDVINLMNTYDLLTYLYQWVESGSFPSKLSWKNIVKSTTIRVHKDLRQYRMSNDIDFSRFLAVFSEHDPSNFWRAPKNCYEIRLWKLICKLVTDRPQRSLNVCHLCGAPFFNLAAHVACSCAITLGTRNNWWTDIINNFTIHLSAELCALPDDDLLLILLGRQSNTELDAYATETFRIKNFKLIQDTSAQYNQLMRRHHDVTNRVN